MSLQALSPAEVRFIVRQKATIPLPKLSYVALIAYQVGDLRWLLAHHKPGGVTLTCRFSSMQAGLEFRNFWSAFFQALIEVCPSSVPDHWTVEVPVRVSSLHGVARRCLLIHPQADLPAFWRSLMATGLATV